MTVLLLGLILLALIAPRLLTQVLVLSAVAAAVFSAGFVVTILILAATA